MLMNSCLYISLLRVFKFKGECLPLRFVPVFVPLMSEKVVTIFFAPLRSVRCAWAALGEERLMSDILSRVVDLLTAPRLLPTWARQFPSGLRIDHLTQNP